MCPPVRQPLTGHTGPVFAVAFGTGAGAGRCWPPPGDDGTMRLWDPHTRAQLMTIRRRVPATALASDGPMFAIGDPEGLSVIDIS
jgi:hypothetical protein